MVSDTELYELAARVLPAAAASFAANDLPVYQRTTTCRRSAPQQRRAAAFLPPFRLLECLELAGQ
jgi:hypothetical protein